MFKGLQAIKRSPSDCRRNGTITQDGLASSTNSFNCSPFVHTAIHWSPQPDLETLPVSANIHSLLWSIFLHDTLGLRENQDSCLRPSLPQCSTLLSCHGSEESSRHCLFPWFQMEYEQEVPSTPDYRNLSGGSKFSLPLNLPQPNPQSETKVASFSFALLWDHLILQAR